jgi:hypothetical protein
LAPSRGTLSASGSTRSTAFGHAGRQDRLHGRIYDSPLSDTPVGRIDSNGRIYDSPLSDRPVGRIDSRGNVYDSMLSDAPTGRIDPNGRIKSLLED